MKLAKQILFLIATLVGGVASAQGYDAELLLSNGMTVQGDEFKVTLRYDVQQDTALEAWRLSAAAISMDGKPLGSRAAGATVDLAAGTKLTLELDLGAKLQDEGSHMLSIEGGQAIAVTVVKPLEDLPDFLELEPKELGEFRALFITNQGPMIFEFFPDKAPDHVRNFLDLVKNGFYEGIQFHRVSPNFMIQGGCPNTKTENVRSWGTGRGPRMLKAEFNDVKHERGILSMARSSDPDSASSQFFVMTRRNAGLDNNYSVFGRMVEGEPTLKRISEAKGEMNPRDRTVRPASPQRILRTVILEKPESL